MKVENQGQPDSERHSQIDRPKNYYIYQSFGQNIHFLYESDQSFEKGSIIFSSMDQKNVCLRLQSRIYKHDTHVLTIEHKQSVVECCCYPCFSNKMIIKKNNKSFAEIKENSIRAFRPFNCCCGKMLNCSNETIQIFNAEQHNVMTLEGPFECAFEMCQEYVRHNIYGQTKQDVFGYIKEEAQFCKCVPYHCSFVQMYSPLLRRNFRIQVLTSVVEEKNFLEMLFTGLVFLARNTKSLIC